MLEFYQAYANYEDMMQITEELIAYVAMEVNGTTEVEFNGHTIDLSKWQRLTMVEAICEYWACTKFGNRPSENDFRDSAALIALLDRAKAANNQFKISENSLSEQTQIADVDGVRTSVVSPDDRDKLGAACPLTR